MLGMGVQSGIKKHNLSHNGLTRPLPNSIRSLGPVTELDMSFNKLGSYLPQSIAELTKLESLKLQRNQFTGPITDEFFEPQQAQKVQPAGKPLMEFPISSYGGNLGLRWRSLPPRKLWSAFRLLPQRSVELVGKRCLHDLNKQYYKEMVFVKIKKLK